MRYTKLILGAFVVVFLLRFGASYFFLLLLSSENQDELAVAAGMPLLEIQTSSTNESGPNEQDAELAKPTKEGTKTANTPQRELFLKQLTLPDQTNPDGKSADRNFYVHALCLDPTGTRVLAVSQRNTYCFDVPSGKVLQTFHNELPTNNPRPQPITASPDARFVIIPSVDGKDLSVREAATGRVIGTCHLTDTSKFNKFLLESRLPAITPAEDYLLVGAGTVMPSTLHALSTKTGAVKVVDVPRLDFSKQDYKYLLPIPQSSTFLVYGNSRVDRKTNPSNLFAVDFSNGKETPLTCLRVTPDFLGWRPLVLSADGTLLLVKGVDTLEVCDWRANRLLFHHEEKVTHFSHASFTPDGKRVAFIVRSKGLVQYETDPITGKSIGHRVADVIHLFDIARQEKIGSCTPHALGLDSLVRALAMSQNGKSFAIWTGSEITFVDFQSAFGVDPLPPSQRLSGPESLPLKQPTEGKEVPRKLK